MTDTLLFQEIDDALKAEKLQQWWQRFGSWVIVACVLIVAATIGYQLYTGRIVEANEQVTSRLLSSSATGDHAATAHKLLQAPEAAGSVTLLATLKAATLLEKAGKQTEAAKALESLTRQQAYPDLAGYAALRLGDMAVAPANKGNPFTPLAQEQQALTLIQQGKMAEAREMLKSLADSAETLPSIRARARELLTGV